jgi:hypothetical protein
LQNKPKAEKLFEAARAAHDGCADPECWNCATVQLVDAMMWGWLQGTKDPSSDAAWVQFCGLVGTLMGKRRSDFLNVLAQMEVDALTAVRH